MNIATHARKTVRGVTATSIIAAMLATAAPASAQMSDNDSATAVTGDGGSVLIALNAALLNCVILVLGPCGDFGGANATGGDSGAANATTTT